MIRSLTLILLVSVCMFPISCGRKKQSTHQPNMIEADVSYITQRCNVMIWNSGDGYEEDNALYIDGMKTVMQNMTFYHPYGEVYMYQSGAAMGMITYLDGRPGYYLPLEEKHQFRIEIDLVHNCMIDVHQQGTDTLCDPVILENLKMIMSADDYRIFRKQSRLPERKRVSKTFTFYRYK